MRDQGVKKVATKQGTKKVVKTFLEDPSKALQSFSVDDIAYVLRIASDAYYNTSEPIVSDDVFDLAKEHIQKKAPKHSVLKEIGAREPEDNKVDLPYWMGSLDKIKDSQKQLDKWLEKYTGSAVVSDKLDGNSGLFVYHNQKVQMYTRGDGFQGHTLGHLLAAGLRVPLTFKDDITVRGEFIISKANWTSDLGANARNVVAGVLHTKTPKREIVQLIDFVAYELLHPKMAPADGMQFMKDQGFNVVNYTIVPTSNVNTDSLSRLLIDRRNDSPYEIDGIVVQHNNINKVVKGKNPKYAFAFKTMLTQTEAEVIVSDVEWNASKDGYLKPTVRFAPVSLNGVTIQKATGFNGAYIRDNRIGIGAHIVIVRSGDVIPHIMRVLNPAQEPKMPDVPFIWTESGVDVRTTDQTGPEVVIRQLAHFSKVMDIKHVSIGTIKKFVEQGGITGIGQMLNMSVDDIKAIDGFRDTSASKVHTALQQVRNNGKCVDFMIASNIFGRGLGKKKIEAIIESQPSILGTRSIPNINEVQEIPGIGIATAKTFIEALPRFFEMMDEAGVPCRVLPVPQQGLKKHFTGESVVFTGFRNSEWEDVVKNNGGKVSGTVSKNTTLIVATNPDEQSAKLNKARDLGIKIISKSDFAARI